MKHPSLLSERDFSSHNGFPTPVNSRAVFTNGHTYHAMVRRFERGHLLFLEGDDCNGVLILRRGRVKLSAEHAAGRAITVGVAEAGDIIGLAAAFAGKEHETTAEALEPCEAEYIGRDEFIHRLDREPELRQTVIQQLSDAYLRVCENLASFAGADPVIVRLARLFAGWAPERNGHTSVNLKNRFTHQQMAEMIGTTRETVTRSLSEMRTRGLATLRNGELSIHDHERLLLLAGNGVHHAQERV